MRTIMWLTAIIALSAFIFSATVNAAYALADNLDIAADKVSIQELATR